MSENTKIKSFVASDQGKTGESVKKHPAFELRAGALKLTAWRNVRKDFVSYSFTLSRRYVGGDGVWRESRSIRDSDLLRAAELLRMAWQRVVLDRMGAVPANKLLEEDVGVVE